jgi:hypothetical protein
MSKRTKEEQKDKTKVVNYIDKICEDKIQLYIDKCYSELAERQNAFEQMMIMKREVIADKGVWTAKKRYVLNVHNSEGVQYAEPKMKIMGLEMIKSSTPSACKEKLWDAIDIVFNKDEDAVIKFIDGFREEFKTMDPADIAFPRGVNGLSKFSDKSSIFGKGCPIHVRGSLIYNDLIKRNKLQKKYELIKEGEKIKFIYLKEPNMIQSNIIAFPNVIPTELDLHKYIDFDMQYEKSFVEPLKIVLDSIGWKTEHVSSLADFFA